MATPAAAVGAAPAESAPAETAPTGAKVEKSKYGSYVVVMKSDPLSERFQPQQLRSRSANTERNKLKAEQGKALKKAGISNASRKNSYTNAVNGFSVVVSHEKAEKLAGDPEVMAVFPDELRQKQSLPTKSVAGDDQIRDRAGESLRSFLGLQGGKYGTKGKNDKSTRNSLDGRGTLLGVIDTGIWPEHPSFADDGSYEPVALDDETRSSCDFGGSEGDADWECNNKLVGARQMLDTYRSVVGVLPGEFDSARDDDGHGSHTAGTAAGNANVPAWIYDEDRIIDRTSGIAPRAQIVAYKALGSLGGFSSDLAAAIDQAVADGVDAINYSVGGGPGLASADAIAFLFANDAGVHVATSAGNSGPGEATIGGPADLPWVTTVGASTQPRFYSGSIKLGNGRTVKGSSVTLPSEKNLPLVDARNLGNEFCLNEAAVGADAWAQFEQGAEGAMVLCWRGVSGRSEKSLNVMDAGGKAMVLSNVTDDDNYFTDNFRVPTVMVDKSEGDLVAAYANIRNAKATITDTAEIDSFTPAPSMASFSSRGPNPSAESIIKPDITAPGVQVLAAASPAIVGDDYEPGQLFQAIAGTSMSSPVMAGYFLLMDQAHPDWSPAAVKSAVMTSAYQDVRDNDRSTPADPFDFGSGHVSALDKVVNPGLVYDSGIFDFLGFVCGSDARGDILANPDAYCAGLEDDGIATTIEDLNYPTIGVSALAGSQTVTRTVTNVTGKNATFRARVDNPEGMDITVSPSTLKLKKGESKSFEVTITNESAPVNSEFQFGAITWKGKGVSVRSNVAAYPTPFSAPSTVTGSGGSGSVEIPVQVGFSGLYTPVPGGLAENTPLTGTVEQDPDQTFGGCTADQPGVTAVPVTVAEDTAYARMAFTLASEDDIDLFLCSGDEVVAESTAGGTNELIEISQPPAGDYTLYVHGWQVVEDSLDFSVDTWLVVRGEGDLTVDPESAEVSTGDVVDVTASWSDAPSGVSFGVVDHTTDGETYGQTVVQVTN
ncbi:S8 family serine peptidase [Phycicoccus sp. BSK3Z-2]|uniref:S8 family serine peptidase n=1 Tax=Phycicoccus avicenniae TaxID=2828860 RepID=A0A941D8M7_9MICO|nr:S8 family serine peptidase [Phycicoccus avicenniae]MBR7744114.1 S8 family serine peptidase [Phycicoccus avicenniae]